MTKAELIAMIAEKSGIAKAQMEEVFNATFEAITEIMVKQGEVKIPGFGKFSTEVRKERKGRNPASGKEIVIPQATVTRFKPALQLKETVNNQK